MRRLVWLVFILMLPMNYPASADDHPFNFYIDEEVVIHQSETVQLRIAWHNIVGDERHFKIELNQTDSSISTSDIPQNFTRVASGRLGEFTINITADENSTFGNHPISFDITCQEDADWKLTHHLDVLVSRWSNLIFGANDGSSFYVQQNVNTSLAVNLTNLAGYTDNVTISMDTNSFWNYGFIGDVDNDKNLLLEIENGSDVFVYFYIMTPPILDGAPLAGTGPAFTLKAQSGLDKRIETWTFSLEMQTYHNITIDEFEQSLFVDPGDDGRLKVTVRNNGNIDTFLDTTLSIGSSENGDRLEINGWTVAIFNAFDLIPLAPNESRIIEIGFDSPNVQSAELSVNLIAQPLNFPQRSESITLNSSIELVRSGNMQLEANSCSSVEVNIICQKMVTLENTGNFYDQFKLTLLDQSGMSFEITEDFIGLSRNQVSQQIPLNITTFENADGFQPGNATLQLTNAEGVILESKTITSSTAPFVNWVWEDAQSLVSNGRLEVSITMRNEGNIVDGLIIKMSSSYFTEMSLIPPDGAIYEGSSSSIRSFEIIDVEKGSNFTFRGWAQLPDDQSSSDDFYLNITANSRLAEDKPFFYSANSSFEAYSNPEDDSFKLVDSFSSLVSNIFQVIWAWKLVLLAMLVSGIMINKSLNDRRIRLENQSLSNPSEIDNGEPEDWMAEFSKKRQPVPSPVESPQIPSEVFTGLFKASSKPSESAFEPVDSRLVNAASTVLDHHDLEMVKTQINELTDSISSGDISTPHGSNELLPDDIIPVTERTVPRPKSEEEIPSMLDLDDLDL